MNDLIDLIPLAVTQPNKATTHDFLKLMWRAGNHADIPLAAKIADCMHRLHTGQSLEGLIPNPQDPPLCLPHIRPPYGFSTLLAICFKNNDMQGAVDAYHSLLLHGYIPGVYTYTIMISVFFAMHKYKEAEEVYNTLLANKIVPNVVTYTALVRGYGVFRRDLVRAQQVVSEMTSHGVLPELATYNALLEAAALAQDFASGAIISHQLLSRGLSPNLETVMSWIKLTALVDKDMSSVALKDLIGQSLSPEALLVVEDALNQCHRSNPTATFAEVERRRKWLAKNLRNPLAKSISPVIGKQIKSSIVQSGLENICQRVFNDGNDERGEVTHHEFTDLLNLCRKKKWYDEAGQVLSVMQKLGIGQRPNLHNLLSSESECHDKYPLGDGLGELIEPQPHLLPTSTHYHIVIETYTNCCKMEEAQFVYQTALDNSVDLESRSYMKLATGWLRSDIKGGPTHALSTYNSQKAAGHVLTMEEYLRLARRFAAYGSAFAFEDEEDGPSNGPTKSKNQKPKLSQSNTDANIGSLVTIVIDMLDDAGAAGVLMGSNEKGDDDVNFDRKERDRQFERLFDTCCRSWDKIDDLKRLADKLAAYDWLSSRSAAGSLSILEYCLIQSDGAKHAIALACSCLVAAIKKELLSRTLSALWLSCLIEIIPGSRNLVAAFKSIFKRRDWLSDLLKISPNLPVLVHNTLIRCEILVSVWMDALCENPSDDMDPRKLGYELLSYYLDGLCESRHEMFASLAAHQLWALFVTVRTAQDKLQLNQWLSNHMTKTLANEKRASHTPYSMGLVELLLLLGHIDGLGSVMEHHQAKLARILIQSNSHWMDTCESHDPLAISALIRKLPLAVYMELRTALNISIFPIDLPTYVIRAARTENLNHVVSLLIGLEGQELGNQLENDDVSDVGYFSEVLKNDWKLGVVIGTWLVSNCGTDRAYRLLKGHKGLPEDIMKTLLNQHKPQLAAKLARHLELPDPRYLDADGNLIEADEDDSDDNDNGIANFHPLAVPMEAVYIIDTEQTLREMTEFFKDPIKRPAVVAIDTEWHPRANTPTALVQVGWSEGVYLVDLLTLSTKGIDFNEAMDALFACKDMVKIGWNINGDLVRLHRTHPLCQSFATVKPVIDLAALPAITRMHAGGDTIGLSKIVEKTLGKPLNKRYQTCNWDCRPLTLGKIRYAATDVTCLIELWKHHRSTHHGSESTHSDSETCPCGIVMDSY